MAIIRSETPTALSSAEEKEELTVQKGSRNNYRPFFLFEVSKQAHRP